MICYRDMTFCLEKTCKNFNKCPRAFTEEERKNAIKWWGSGKFPLCIFSNLPPCFDEKENLNETDLHK